VRYDQLLTLIAMFKPRTIAEVGTNAGERGLAMCREALKHRGQVHYTGFDVFESESEDFHREAFNGKGFFRREAVAARFAALAQERSGFSFDLLQGRTSDTLHPRRRCVDFAFIDGDHRVDAILADYAALRGTKVIVFDDYYAPGLTPVDLSHIGCNRVVGRLRNHVVLPVEDVFDHVGPIRMALVLRPHMVVGTRVIWLPDWSGRRFSVTAAAA
jgi:predicted O-methyltransferase YrrM